MLNELVTRRSYWQDRILSIEKRYDNVATEFAKQFNVTFDMLIEHAAKCELSYKVFHLRDVPKNAFSDERREEMKQLLVTDDGFFDYLERNVLAFVKDVLEGRTPVRS